MTEPAASDVPAVRRGRPPKISRASVVAEALALARAEGLARVGPRSVARRLGVTPVALYSHVISKEHLLDLVLEQAIHEAAMDIDWPNSWEESLMLVGTSLRRLFMEQPLLLEAHQRRSVLVPSSLDVADHLIGQMREAGLPDAAAVDIYVLMLSLCATTASRAAQRSRTAALSGQTPDEIAQRAQDQMREGGNHPHVEALSAELAVTDGEERFQSALRLLVEAGRIRAHPQPAR